MNQAHWWWQRDTQRIRSVLWAGESVRSVYCFIVEFFLYNHKGVFIFIDFHQTQAVVKLDTQEFIQGSLNQPDFSLYRIFSLYIHSFIPS